MLCWMELAGFGTAVVGFALGLAAWPFVEYAIHGVLAHRLRTPVSPLHWAHHVEPRRVFTSPLAWVPIAILLGAALTALVGIVLALPFVLGVLAGFFHYEYVHWRIHFRAPRTERQRRLREHHLAHHFRNPRAYHGVSSHFCDRLFGTLPPSWREDYAAVARRPPLQGRSNLGQLVPRDGV